MWPDGGQGARRAASGSSGSLRVAGEPGTLSDRATSGPSSRARAHLLRSRRRSMDRWVVAPATRTTGPQVRGESVAPTEGRKTCAKLPASSLTSVRVHDFRHVQAFWVLAGERRPQERHGSDGHAQINTTQRYLHTRPMPTPRTSTPWKACAADTQAPAVVSTPHRLTQERSGRRPGSPFSRPAKWPIPPAVTRCSTRRIGLCRRRRSKWNVRAPTAMGPPGNTKG